MEERGHRETRGGNQPLTSLDLVDPDRLSRFRYGVVTWIDKDGFPFSVATDFLLSENGEILLKRPSVPAIITGGRVGVLFNHITWIPTGGYTDRRYILVWGRVSEDKVFLKLHAEELSVSAQHVLPSDGAAVIAAIAAIACPTAVAITIAVGSGFLGVLPAGGGA